MIDVPIAILAPYVVTMIYQNLSDYEFSFWSEGWSGAKIWQLQIYRKGFAPWDR